MSIFLLFMMLFNNKCMRTKTFPNVKSVTLNICEVNKAYQWQTNRYFNWSTSRFTELHKILPVFSVPNNVSKVICYHLKSNSDKYF